MLQKQGMVSVRPAEFFPKLIQPTELVLPRLHKFPWQQLHLRKPHCDFESDDLNVKHHRSVHEDIQFIFLWSIFMSLFNNCFPS